MCRKPPGSPFDGATITTERLRLAPLQAEDADEMVAVLGDERLHEFVGGRPSSLAELRDRYTRLSVGSPDPDTVWLNWIVRLRVDSQPVGTMQATIATHDGRRVGHIAWVIGVDWQSQGFASEAARALVDWLRSHGIDDIAANIHPDHRASATVAARVGLQPTDEQADGERVWRTPSC